jgi:hypothetical protein
MRGDGVNVHKILSGDGAEQHLPMALSKLRVMVRRATNIQVQRYRTGEASVLIECNPQANQHFIRIDMDPGTIGYEFFSTFDDVAAFPVAWWSTAVIPNPVSAEAPFTVKPISTAFGDGVTVVTDIPRDPLARAINGQRNPEHHWWQAKDSVVSSDAVRTKPAFMTSTHAAPTWMGNEVDFQSFLSSYVVKGDGRAIPWEQGYDIGVDVIPTLYEKSRAVGAFPNPILPNWPRRAAYLETGGRRFVIMSDMQSNFYAYPVSYMTADPVGTAFNHVRAKKVGPAEYMPPKVAKPTMTSMRKRPRGVFTEVPIGGGAYRWWAPARAPSPILAPYALWPESVAEDGADETLQFQSHHYLWEFNGTGTKAAAVVHTNLRTLSHEGEAVSVLAEYGPQYRVTPSEMTAGWITAAGGTAPLKVSERAVLEVGFNISVTGTGEDDFTFSVVAERLIEDGWFFDAQYAYTDSRLETLGVLGDDLLTDEFRIYGTPGVETIVGDAFIITREHRTGSKVASFCVNNRLPWSMYEQSFPIYTTAPEGTYPGVPPAVWRWFFQDRYLSGPYMMGIMVGSDLRSMSKVFHIDSETDSGLHTVVFGEVRTDKGLSVRNEAASLTHGLTRMPTTFVVPGTTWLPSAVPADDRLTSMPVALHRLVYERTCKSMGFDTTVATSLATHPDGHFAAFCHYYGADDVFDLIEYRRVAIVDDIPNETFDQTTHLDAFAKAFGYPMDMVLYKANLASTKPLVVQRFSSWRNVKLPKLAASSVYTLNERLKDSA